MLKINYTYSKNEGSHTQIIKNVLYVGQKITLEDLKHAKTIIREPKMKARRPKLLEKCYTQVQTRHTRSKIFKNDYTETNKYYLGIPNVKKALYVEQNCAKLIKNSQTQSIVIRLHQCCGRLEVFGRPPNLKCKKMLHVEQKTLEMLKTYYTERKNEDSGQQNIENPLHV